MLLCLAAGMARIIKPFGVAKKFINLVCKGEKFFQIDQIYDPIIDRACKQLTLLLPGRGCSWFKKSGGCTMCGFSQKLEEINQSWNLSASDLTALYKIAELLSRFEKPERLCVFNGGSFLNENEIPLKTQFAIARAVKSHTSLKSLFIESRPEFITDESISLLLNALGQKKLEIGIGLEAVTDDVREVFIHKGFNLKDYEKAVEIIKSHGDYLLTYVFLKPLYLSEGEAIEEAVKTIEYAFKTGSDEVSLSCAFIQRKTQMAEFYERGEFILPWLWSIIEVIRRTAHLGPVRIGSFEDEPPPVAIPSNCTKCSQKVEDAIKEYNLSRNTEIFASLSCECQKLWQKETEKA